MISNAYAWHRHAQAEVIYPSMANDPLFWLWITLGIILGAFAYWFFFLRGK